MSARVHPGKYLLDRWRHWRDRVRILWLRLLRRRQGQPSAVQGATVIIGAVGSDTGVGEGARLMFRACQARGKSVTAVDISPIAGLRLTVNEDPYDVLPQTLPSGTRIIHLNPPNIGLVLWHYRHQIYRDRVIGYWAWELEKAPESWRPYLSLLDEIWVPSEFVAAAVKSLEGLTIPVRIVPHPVEYTHRKPPSPEAKSALRRKHDIGAGHFVVGYTFAMLSGYERKNPEAAIETFKLALADRPDCHLILRCPDAGKRPQHWARLQQLTADQPRIRLHSDISIDDFYGLIDLYLSLHRSEGFGLTLHEAVQLGIPVMAPSWNLPQSLIEHPLYTSIEYALTPVSDPAGTYISYKQMRWVQPKIPAAARKLFLVANSLCGIYLNEVQLK